MADKNRVISMAECDKHKTEEDVWLVIHGKVYDVTAFANEHPGGVDTLTKAAGIDGSAEFDSVGHSDSAKDQLKKYQIGVVDKEDLAAWNKKKGTSSQVVAGGNSFVSFAIVLGLLAVVLYLILKP